MFNQLNIGLSALRAAQVGLDVVGQNLANANTPGYHRQLVQFADRPSIHLYGLELGTGVDVSRIHRVHSSVVENALLRHVSDQEATDARLDSARQLESIFASRTGSLPDRLNNLFERLVALSPRPEDSVARQDFVHQAGELAATLGTLAADIDRISDNITHEAHGIVDRINVLADDIQQLNLQIRAATLQGREPNDLLDRRDQMVSELAEYVDVRLDVQQDRVVLGDGTAMIGGTTFPGLEIRTTTDGLEVYRRDGTTPMGISRGKLAGILATVNDSLTGYNEQLNQLAIGLVATLDAQHAQGVGLSGSFRVLNSGRPVSDVNAPLKSLDTALPITNGTLHIGVVDASTGERQQHVIDVDAKNDSLVSMTAKLSAIPGLTAIIDSQSGHLTISGDAGVEFDFTGLPQSLPDASSLTGTSQPRMSGIHVGDHNEQLQFIFAGSGQVGVTPNLQMEVRNRDGTLLETVAIGQGYPPGDEILLAGGLKVQLSAGTVTQGESFVSDAVVQSDDSNFLVALGLNTLFVGQDAGSLKVHPDILRSRDRLATSISGFPGDSTNINRMLARREVGVSPLGGRAIDDAAEELTAMVGADVQALEQASESLTIVGENLRVRRDSISGVDSDEELVNMLQFQRSYESAARFLSAINETTSELMRILQ